jgi:hypothetical protein
VRRRLAIVSAVSLIVLLIGLVVSVVLNSTVFDEFDAYGEVPVPGTRTLHLPAGDVTVSFHGMYPQGADTDKPLPSRQDLELTITAPSGVAEPNVTEDSTQAVTTGHDAHRSEWVAHIAQAGDYTITTNGKVTPYVSPRLSFGHLSRFWFVSWLFGGLCVVMFLMVPVWVSKWRRGLAGAVQGTGQIHSVLRKGLAFTIGQDGHDYDPTQVQCQIAWQVQLPGRPPYQATIRQVVPLAMSNLQPGATVVVAADSQDPQNVRIDFTQPIRPAAPPA